MTMKKHHKGRREDVEPSDRISQLPVGIITKILSLLTFEDAIKTCNLSNRWRYFWSCFPVLEFEPYKLIKSPGNKRNRDVLEQSLMSCINGILERHGTDVSLDKFRFDFHHCINSHWDFLVQHWIFLALASQVKELEVTTKPKYVFSPQLVRALFSSEFLAVLELRNSFLESPASTNLPSLKTLSLDSTNIDDENFNRLIEGCPLIENLCLKQSERLFTCQVSCLRLKSLELSFCKNLDTLKIECPRIESFVFKHCKGTDLDISRACKELKTLSFVKIRKLTSPILNGIVSRCPQLESLTVYECKLIYSIEVSNYFMKRFRLDTHCYYEGSVELDTPNLLSFECYGNLKAIRELHAPKLQDAALHPACLCDVKDCEIGGKELRERLIKPLRDFQLCHDIKLFDMDKFEPEGWKYTSRWRPLLQLIEKIKYNNADSTGFLLWWAPPLHSLSIYLGSGKLLELTRRNLPLDTTYYSRWHYQVVMRHEVG